MISTAVQHERGPRNSTLRRHLAVYIKEAGDHGPGYQDLLQSHSPGLLGLPPSSATSAHSYLLHHPAAAVAAAQLSQLASPPVLDLALPKLRHPHSPSGSPSSSPQRIHSMPTHMLPPPPALNSYLCSPMGFPYIRVSEIHLIFRR